MPVKYICDICAEDIKTKANIFHFEIYREFISDTGENFPISKIVYEKCVSKVRELFGMK